MSEKEKTHRTYPVIGRILGYLSGMGQFPCLISSIGFEHANHIGKMELQSLCLPLETS